MGNRIFELPCADRKTREKILLNKYDRTKLYEENKEKAPRSQRILNQVENIIHNHERETSKNSIFIESNKKYDMNIGGSPQSTYESTEIETLKVDYSNKKSIVSILNTNFFGNQVKNLCLSENNSA